MKKIILITLVAIILIFASVKLYYIRGYLGLGSGQCPEAWYDNQMPSDGPSAGSRRYLIIKGERRELSEFNMEWIKSNCKVNKASIVY